MTGFESGKDAWRRLVEHFPDYRVVAEEIIVERDKVAVRSTVQGVPAGDVEPMLMEIFRVADGRFVEAWGIGQGLPLDVLRD